MSETVQTTIQKIDSYLHKSYSVKQNFFDPAKYSPPNEFMQKLKLRMQVYNNC